MKKHQFEPDIIGGQRALTKAEEIALSQYFSKAKVKKTKSANGCIHVNQTELFNASDMDIWKYATGNDKCVVTLDSDFLDILTLKGFPPKINIIKIW
jgi:predicted nuclease of predicted toxin-antitoxin system